MRALWMRPNIYKQDLHFDRINNQIEEEKKNSAAATHAHAHIAMPFR